MQRQQLNSMYWKNEMMNYDEQLYVKNVRKQRGISTIESREPLSTGLHWIEIISNWDGSEFFRKYPTSYLSCIFPSNAIVFHRIHLSTRSSCVRTQELLNTNETETPIDITWSCFDRPIWFFTILLGFFVCVKFALIFFCFEFFLFRIILLVKLIYCLAISTKLSNSWISFHLWEVRGAPTQFWSFLNVAHCLFLYGSVRFSPQKWPNPKISLQIKMFRIFTFGKSEFNDSSAPNSVGKSKHFSNSFRNWS